MGFTRQEYWDELPFLPPGDLPDLEINVKRLLEGTIKKKLLDIGLGNNVLDATPKAQTRKAKIKGDYIKLKSFHTAKETVNKIKRQPIEWEKIFADHMVAQGKNLPAM